MNERDKKNEPKKAPKDIGIEESFHSYYEAMKQGKILPELKNYEMAYLFMFALSYGVYYNKRKPLEKRKGSISKNFLENNFKWVIRAVAINNSSKGIEILTDESEIYQIIEEFANGGIQYIKNEIDTIGPGKFEKDMEYELLEIISQYS